MHQVDKERLVKHFSQAASAYDTYAQVQKKMAVRLLAFAKAEQKKPPQRILEIGCGTGYLTQLLAREFPKSSILATDISSAMVKTAQSKLDDQPQVRFAQMDGERLDDGTEYDLIIANAVFQWFAAYSRAFTGFYRHLIPGGNLIYSTFGAGTFEELQTAFSQAYQKNSLPTAYQSGPRFQTVQELAAVSAQLGFASSYREHKYREYFPTVKDFLKSIKKVGANNANRGENLHVPKKVMLNMLEYYQEQFCENQQVYATYHVIFGASQKRMNV
ncbi:malonyl-ACP O-methyltransferase BioC [Anaeroarcus burkinensis]|uniref:malonyl-ACP O-methyltransferase BioC n=1 Tax=Anaeroarcus burkinensis TaxID=82376 RepID=UPI0003FBAFBC|nr:malonyl-ACP O-methyltransferase BioC [Anaeroarcus burkinensis]